MTRLPLVPFLHMSKEIKPVLLLSIAGILLAGTALLARCEHLPQALANDPGASAPDFGDGVCRVAQPTRFAVIGDFGRAGQPAADVAALVESWQPDFVITLGDNNYPDGEAATIDDNIGQYYHAFIGSYKGSYGAGSATPRFFPSLGNHDWHAADVTPYRNYFTLPGNERYYDFVWGCLTLYALDSDGDEPDGNRSSSKQASWLQMRLAMSSARWHIAYFHHPPYSSGSHGSQSVMQWPFKAWGIDAVMAGHDHVYERLLIGDLPYFVNGLGGTPNIYSFGAPLAGSQVRYNEDFGAMLVTADFTNLTVSFITRTGDLIDSLTLSKPVHATHFPLTARDALSGRRRAPSIRFGRALRS